MMHSLGAISSYSVDPATGLLTALAEDSTAGQLPEFVTVTPNGRFLYTTSLVENTISGFTIDPLSGALTEMPGSPFLSGLGTIGLAVDGLRGRLLFAANQSADSISVFVIDPDTGVLTLSSTLTAADGVGDAPYAVATSPVTNRFYVTNHNLSDSTVSGFSYDDSGVATALPDAFAEVYGLAPDLSFDPSGRYLYAGASHVEGFSVDSVTGALTAITGSPYVVGGSPLAPAFHPWQPFAYLTVRAYGVVSLFSFDSSTGALEKQEDVLSGLGDARSHAIDASGRYFYVVDQTQGLIYAFGIDETLGTVTPLSTPTFATAGSPTDFVMTP